MNIVACDYEHHAAAILAILNDAIVTRRRCSTTAARACDAWSSGSVPRSPPVPRARRRCRRRDAARVRDLRTFRAWPAYKYTIEHSVYVHGITAEGRRAGAHAQLIAAAEQQDYHVMVAGIDAANAASIALHEQLGFVHAGVIHHAGFKFGRWLDLALYELRLRTPAQPVDG